MKTPEIIERMRHAGAVAAEVLRLAGEMVRPGITTDDDRPRTCTQLCIERNAYPSPLNYNGYPKSVCTSVNEVICHGIPDSRVLHDGDIVNIDVTCYIGGVHGDTNATFFVGDVDPESRQLVQVTEECMWHGIEAVVPGQPLSDIGRAIESPRQEAPLRRGEGVHRSRHRRAVPHRRPGAALLRPAGQHDHAAGHDVHDRADDHRSAPGSTRWCSTTTGRRSPPTASAPPSSSTPAWSPTTVSRCSPRRAPPAPAPPGTADRPRLTRP